MTRALVVFCHPVEDSLVGAACRRVLAGLDAAGAAHRFHDLHRDGFRPASTGTDDLAGYAADLRWCDMLVFVYPTWWGGQPALLKGWIDRVWTDGVAWERPDGEPDERGEPAGPLLGDIGRLVVVTTHGSSKLVNVLEGEGGKRTVGRALRAVCHPRAQAHWIALYGVDTGGARRRERFLDRVERRLASLAARPPL